MKFSLFYLYIYIERERESERERERESERERVNDAGDARKLLFSIIYVYKSIVFLYFRS